MGSLSHESLSLSESVVSSFDAMTSSKSSHLGGEKAKVVVSEAGQKVTELVSSYLSLQHMSGDWRLTWGWVLFRLGEAELGTSLTLLEDQWRFSKWVSMISMLLIGG